MFINEEAVWLDKQINCPVKIENINSTNVSTRELLR